jgi:RNA polymerase sigma-70 factor (ECF subfamily)
MGSSDAELIQRWRGGDSAAFEDLVQRWQRPVARFLCHLAGRRAPIEDRCQEVFLRVYRTRADYREQGAFSTWLFQIALNVARDARDRAGREERLLGSVGPQPPAVAADVVCQTREHAALVQRALTDLPEELRIVVVLKHYEGLRFAEIARITGTPASTVKSRFAAALQRLRETLRELDPAEP